MRIFDLYFSKRWSFLFPDTCLTWRRLEWIVFIESVPRLFAPGFPGTVFHFEKLMLPSLSRRNPSEIQFSQQPHHSCRRIVALFLLFVWLFVNLMMREQTLIPGLTTRFIFFELTFGRMPILTRRSRASTFQIVSARLSKNGTGVTFAFLDTLRPRDAVGSECVAAFGFWFLLSTIVTLMPKTALVSLRTLASFFPLVASTFSCFNAT